MSIAICPGSFDPITLGHLNIIRRTARIFDEVVVVIMQNSTKKSPMFTVEERVEMVRKATERYKNVKVDSSDILLAEYARQYEGAVIVKGLRAASDFEYEFQMNLINKQIRPEFLGRQGDGNVRSGPHGSCSERADRHDRRESQSMEKQVMDNNNEAIQLLDILYGMIADAWEVPMNKDKCIIEREKALDIISKVKIILPTELTEAKRLVSTRNEFILNTRKEAEAIKKNAQETQRRLLDEQQIIKTANERAAAILSDAEQKSDGLRKAASEYIDGIVEKARSELLEALQAINTTSSQLDSARAVSEPGQEAPDATKTRVSPKPRKKIYEVDDENFIPIDVE